MRTYEYMYIFVNMYMFIYSSKNAPKHFRRNVTLDFFINLLIIFLRLHLKYNFKRKWGIIIISKEMFT